MTQASATHLSLTTGSADTAMVFWMRLLLAFSAVLTLLVVPAEATSSLHLTWLVFSGYTVHSAALYLLSRREQPFWHGKTIYWLDICWYALMVYSSGGTNSYFFPFFFFAILAASFQWGFDEGAYITLGSTVLLAAAVAAGEGTLDVSHLLLRATFVLGLGYMIAFWGGLGVAQRRRLALLRDVSGLSNPRFGVDQTIASVLNKTCTFYAASSCIVLMREPATDNWLLRTARAPGNGPAYAISRIGGAAAAPLLAFGAQQIVLFSQAIGKNLRWQADTRVTEPEATRWTVLAGSTGEELADLLDARSFISAPLQLRKGQGRIYVVAPDNRLGKADALFLNHIAAQAFPVIENIELLDRLASDAAFRERQKIARDLHDTTIQPYIGLRHGINALRNAASPDNPLNADLDKLIGMTTEVIGDMRQFAKNFQRPQDGVPELLVALRRQAAQVQQFYGIAIGISCDGTLDINDRLSAEVFQIVNEGMSNIRKHTLAKQGAVRLVRQGATLQILIENDNAGEAAGEFLPVSIAERSAALGGNISVTRTAQGGTAVHVSIPV